MSYENSSDEVADDYLQALRGLEMNSRYEISNLTVIAKENTEHALAIAEAVKTHIKQAPPHKKLPAFYVLDSVVKNVGTPYTLFFGRQLYATFMEAYALVDSSTRRKMDEMLKTWKEPVPGSMDTRSVFPPEITRPIENALIKARTSALQLEQQRTQQQGYGRGRPMSAPYRNTPTPPGAGRPPPHQAPPGYAANYNQPQYPPPSIVQQGYTPPPGVNQQFPSPTSAYSSSSPNQYAASGQPYPPSTQQYPPITQQFPPGVQQYPPDNQHYPPNNQPTPLVNLQQYPPSSGQQYGSYINGHQTQGLPQRPPSQQYSQPPVAAPSWQQPQNPGYGAPESTVDTLNRDISDLIATSKADFANNYWDSSIQTRLKALLDLQTILSSQQLPSDQIALIRNQVTQLSEAAYSSVPQVAQPHPLPPPPPAHVASVQPPVQQSSLSSLLGPGALAALLARQSATPQPVRPAAIRSPPPPPQSLQPVISAPAATPSTSTPLPDHNSLLERLRAAGILQSGTPFASTPALPLNALAGKPPPGFPPSFLDTPPNASRTPLAEIPNDVILKSASLKLPRPHLISSLYEKLGQPCNQCGRRFHIDEAGKKRKAAHLDWHFQSAHRMSDAMLRGQHRSWYVDELDWIRSRDIDPDLPARETNNGAGATATDQKLKAIFLPVPADLQLRNVPCPICQEQFKQQYLDDEQDFVWMDAIKVGEKIFHATCYEEAYGTKSQAGMKRGTPDPSVLGKRKAENEHFALRGAKIKSEPV
ncbi:pcf11 [Hyphodiscus hymeniophilus]|uniref:Pcf11 n=1 Tax=Hyphodiscus hymeniophilus TaxID=353542 RepID=A0A9P6VHM8_9HELO|nr:pcf11 [Hyphodiscus hymeniophilus]